MIMINGSPVSVWVSMIDSFTRLVSEGITFRKNVGKMVKTIIKPDLVFFHLSTLIKSRRFAAYMIGI